MLEKSDLLCKLPKSQSSVASEGLPIWRTITNGDVFLVAPQMGWPKILVKRCDLKFDVVQIWDAMYIPLCLASWSSDAMQATMSPAAFMDGIIPPVTELHHLSVGHWLQPAGFWVQQWWAMKNPTQDTRIITSICWSLIITNFHSIPNHTVAMTALKPNIESSKYYLLCFQYASVPALEICIAYRISKE